MDPDTTALVTGASSGIGRATAERLGERGAGVGVHYHANEAGAEDVVEAVRAAGGRALAVQADLADPDEAEVAVEAVASELGPVDVLVNNAGVFEDSAWEDLDPAAWQRTLLVNAGGVFAVTRHVVPGMARRGEGAVVNVASIWAHRGRVDRAAYTASKGAVEALTRQLCVEFGPAGVRVNAVSPGPIRTPITEGLVDDEAWYEDAVDPIPAGRLGEPEEVAAVICFLASEAASYVNGATVPVDGGRLAE